MRKTAIVLLAGIVLGIGADRLYVKIGRRMNAARYEQARHDVMAWRRAVADQIEAERRSQLEKSVEEVRSLLGGKLPLVKESPRLKR